MALESVNTNMGAMVALQSLESTQSQLATTQKQISTGYRVADSTDDGAAYAIAQSIRSTVGALTSANQQLGSVQGLLQTTQSGLNDVSNTMASMRDVLVNLSNDSLTSTQQADYQAQYASLLANVKSFISDATYNGKTLIGNIGRNKCFGLNPDRMKVAQPTASRRLSGSALYHAISFSAATLGAAAQVLAELTTTGDLHQSAEHRRYLSQHDRQFHQLRQQSDDIQQRQSRRA